MAELSLTCPPTSSTGGGGSGGTVEIDKLALIRTGGPLSADTPLDINDPGSGWVSIGGPVLFSGPQEFVEQIQTFRNGVLQLPGESSGDDYDVYFVSASGTIAFENNVHKHDVVQVWHFTTISG